MLKKIKQHIKNYRILLAAIIAFILSACSETYTSSPLILKAESVMNEHPDSAFQLLSSIHSPEKLPKADYAAWCLHYTQAQYKLYMTIQSDSLIDIAVSYYGASKLKKYSGLSYYLQGCVSELLHKYEKAMLAYNMAERILTDSKDYDIKGLIAINTGYLYQRNENFGQAFINFRKAAELFSLSGNKKYLQYAYLELSNTCYQLDRPLKTTMHYSNKALNLAREIGDSLLYFQILSRQGELLYRKDQKTAIANLKAGFEHCANLRTRNASFLAYLYSKTNHTDSVQYYLRIANEKIPDGEEKIFNELTKAAMFENQANFTLAYASMEKAYIMQDTVFRQKLKDQLYKIDKQFNLAEKEKENARLKIANRNVIIGISFLTIAILVVFIVFLRLNIYLKKREAAIVLKQQQTEFELKEYELNNTKKRELLLQKLQQRMEMTVRYNKLQQSLNDPKKQAEFIEHMTNHVILDKAEWDGYIQEANSIFDNRIAQLTHKHKELTPSDIIVIVLISLGMDIHNSCILLNLSKETMYARRKRIKKHLGLEIETELEEWITKNICCPPLTFN